MKKVWLLTSGDGSDGNEWQLHSIHSTEDKAKEAQKKYQHPRSRPDGSTYFFSANIEEWTVD